MDKTRRWVNANAGRVRSKTTPPMQNPFGNQSRAQVFHLNRVLRIGDSFVKLSNSGGLKRFRCCEEIVKGHNLLLKACIHTPVKSEQRDQSVDQRPT